MTQRTIMFSLSDVWGPRFLENFAMPIRLKLGKIACSVPIRRYFCKYRHFFADDNVAHLLLCYFNTHHKTTIEKNAYICTIDLKQFLFTNPILSYETDYLYPINFAHGIDQCGTKEF